MNTIENLFPVNNNYTNYTKWTMARQVKRCLIGKKIKLHLHYSCFKLVPS